MIEFLLRFDFYHCVVPATYKERPTTITQDMKDYLTEHHQDINVQSVGTKMIGSINDSDNFHVFRIKTSRDTFKLTLFKLKYSEYFYVN